MALGSEPAGETFLHLGIPLDREFVGWNEAHLPAIPCLHTQFHAALARALKDQVANRDQIAFRGRGQVECQDHRLFAGLGFFQRFHLIR